uniref:Uncharacterized protein n=1 Tax=Arundo donax TaxID=35708 RepID=A0A0A9CL07_ARUDO
MLVPRLNHLEILRGSLCKLLRTIKIALILSTTSFRIKSRLIALRTLTSLCLHNLPWLLNQIQGHIQQTSCVSGTTRILSMVIQAINRKVSDLDKTHQVG